MAKNTAEELATLVDEIYHCVRHTGLSQTVIAAKIEAWGEQHAKSYAAYLEKGRDGLIGQLSQSQVELAEQKHVNAVLAKDAGARCDAEDDLGVRLAQSQAEVERLKHQLKHAVGCMNRSCRTCNSILSGYAQEKP